MKIAVYAICRNEKQNVRTWFESIKEADEIVVLDTGSTDGTQDILRELDVKVYDYEIPREQFRFDEARNKSLSLVSDDVDVCVCIDFDMTLSKGWRDVIEAVWCGSIKKLVCPVICNGKKTNIYLDRFHSRRDFKWHHAIYETIENDKDKSFRVCNDIVVNVVKRKRMILHDEKFELYRRLLLVRMEEEPDDINVYRFLYELYKTATTYWKIADSSVTIWV